MITGFKAFYQRHEKWMPPAFFVLGFLFDVFTLGRIDDTVTILQQAVYLAVAGLLLSLEILEEQGSFSPPELLRKAWSYREAAIHFILGSLLSAYTLFYFKSASVFSSFAFIALLIAILVVNEFKRFGGSQTIVHMLFFSLCLISYFVYLVPILMGFIGVVPFLVAMTASIGWICLLFWFLGRKAPPERMPRLRRVALYPALGMHLVFLVLYFTQAIPPVPLSVRFMGIYHDIKKEKGKYLLSYLHENWWLWQNGDQYFEARPGDKVYCFVQIFSPTRFKDQVQVRWLYKDAKRGWVPSDAIVFPISGGRDEGYRGFTVKTNYHPGDWRVQVETTDNREIGRLYLTIVEDLGVEPRTFRVSTR